MNARLEESLIAPVIVISNFMNIYFDFLAVYVYNVYIARCSIAETILNLISNARVQTPRTMYYVHFVYIKCARVTRVISAS